MHSLLCVCMSTKIVYTMSVYCRFRWFEADASFHHRRLTRPTSVAYLQHVISALCSRTAGSGYDCVLTL